MRLREMPFSFQLAHDLHSDLRPFTVLQSMFVVVH
jgi:hypothetical protein